MSELPEYPSDAAICRLLAAGPLSTASIAKRLAMPERTVRYRLGELRRAGFVASGIDGLHRLADPVASALATLPLQHEPTGDLAVPSVAPATGWDLIVLFAMAGLAGGGIGALFWVATRMGRREQRPPAAPTPAPNWPYPTGWPAPASW